MNLRNKNGSITIFVLVGLLFMSAFLIVSYANNVNRSKIAKEQFNIISDIYMSNENIVESYTEAYTDLRSKNKDILIYDSETEVLTSVSEIELTKTYEDKVSNYQIYGNVAGVGNLVSDETDENYNKYIISIRITDIKEDIVDDSVIYQEEVYNIVMKSPLYENDYIDYNLRQIIRSDGTIENINLPAIYMFEDYTRIEILTDIFPSRIKIEYIGYTI